MFQDETCQRRRPRGYRKKLNLSSPYPSPGPYYQHHSGGPSYEMTEMGDLQTNSYPYVVPQYDYTSTGTQFVSAAGPPDPWSYIDQYPKVQAHSPMQQNNDSPSQRPNHPNGMHPLQHPGSPPPHPHHHHQPHMTGHTTTNILDYAHHGYSGYPSSPAYGNMDNGTY